MQQLLGSFQQHVQDMANEVKKARGLLFAPLPLWHVPQWSRGEPCQVHAAHMP